MKVHLRKFKYPSGAFGWEVWWIANGKRLRKKFQTEREAVTYRDHVAIQLVGGTNAEELREFQACLHKLRAAVGHPGRHATISQVFDFFVANFRGEVYSKLSVYIDDFLARKGRKVRPKSMVQYAHYLGHLRQHFGHQEPSHVTPEQLETYLHHQTSRPHREKSLRAFWAWLAGKPASRISALQYPPLRRDTFDFVEKASYRKVGLTTVLHPPEVIRLLQAAKRFSPELLAHVAFSVFTGMRPEEVQLFWTLSGHGWDRIDLARGVITVTSEIEKTRKRSRDVKIRPNLRAWLDWIKAEKVTPHATRDTLRAIWRPLFGRKSRQDIFRHTFLSHAARTTPLAELVVEAATSLEMLRNHYLRLVTDEEAAAFFAITPSIIS